MTDWDKPPTVPIYRRKLITPEDKQERLAWLKDVGANDATKLIIRLTDNDELQWYLIDERPWGRRTGLECHEDYGIDFPSNGNAPSSFNGIGSAWTYQQYRVDVVPSWYLMRKLIASVRRQQGRREKAERVEIR
jgi:hypothetical protein